MNPSRRKKPKTLNSPKAHIALGLSGGVDSATSAALLLSQGYHVTGVTCVFNGADAGTASEKSSTIVAAESVCRALGIDHVVYDVREVFRERPIHYRLRTRSYSRTMRDLQSVLQDSRSVSGS